MVAFFMRRVDGTRADSGVRRRVLVMNASGP